MILLKMNNFSDIIILTFMIEKQDINVYMKGTKVHTYSISDIFTPVKFDMTTQDSRKHVIFLNSEMR